MNRPRLGVCFSLVFFAVRSGVGATNTGPEEAIPPLRPPRPELPPGFWEQYWPWFVIGAPVLLAALAAVVWYATRPKPPILTPPASQARQELEPLRRQPETGAVLSRVSQVLRHYIAAAFALPFGELTTGEFSRAIAGREQIGPDLSGALTQFLRECDQRKFAPAPPAVPLGAVQRAAELIDRAEAQRERLRQATAAAPPAATKESRS
jgi:hypothetical protein